MIRLLTVVLMVGSVACAAPAEKPTIAVLTFKGVNTSAGDAEAVTQFVRTAVVKSGEFVVVDKENMEKVLAEQAFQQTGCTDADCAVKLGKMLNSKLVFVGKYTVFEGARLISAEIVDVETGRIQASESQNITDVARIEENAGELVDKMLGAMASDGESPQAAKRKVRRERRAGGRPIAHAGKFGIGLNYAGGGIRVNPLDNIGVEVRGQYEPDILVVGGRLQRYFGFFGNPLVYIGVEGAYVTFKGDASEGTGYAAAGMVGGEYFLWGNRFSVAVDFGPAYVALDEKDYAISVTGVEFIANVGITFYFN